MKVSILGAEYEVIFTTEAEDKILADCDGYCDYTARKIVVDDDMSDSNFGNVSFYQKKVLRHEIVHAFLFESGMAENSKRSEAWAMNEEMVDWMAFQGPKIIKAWYDVGAL